MAILEKKQKFTTDFSVKQCSHLLFYFNYQRICISENEIPIAWDYPYNDHARNLGLGRGGGCNETIKGKGRTTMSTITRKEVTSDE